jgi:hypothetical protein
LGQATDRRPGPLRRGHVVIVPGAWDIRSGFTGMISLRLTPDQLPFWGRPEAAHGASSARLGADHAGAKSKCKAYSISQGYV